MRRGFADTSDGQLHYIEAGADEPVVLLHQSPRSVSMWRKATPLLAMRYRVVAFDLPGFGETDMQALHGEVADVAAMGRAAIHPLDALGIARAHLCGVYTGAFIAARAAAQGGDRFCSLAIFGYPFIESDAEYRSFFAAKCPPSAPIGQPEVFG